MLFGRRPSWLGSTTLLGASGDRIYARTDLCCFRAMCVCILLGLIRLSKGCMPTILAFFGGEGSCSWEASTSSKKPTSILREVFLVVSNDRKGFRLFGASPLLAWRNMCHVLTTSCRRLPDEVCSESFFITTVIFLSVVTQQWHHHGQFALLESLHIKLLAVPLKTFKELQPHVVQVGAHNAECVHTGCHELWCVTLTPPGLTQVKDGHNFLSTWSSASHPQRMQKGQLSSSAEGLSLKTSVCQWSSNNWVSWSPSRNNRTRNLSCRTLISRATDISKPHIISS